MKKIFFLLLILPLLFVAHSCEKDLPYPIDDVKRGVVIDIIRSAGTDGVLFRDQTDGNFKVKMTIPEQQGDYSILKFAQLVAVLQKEMPDPTEDDPGRRKTVTEAKVYKDNITQFPQEFQIDVAELYGQFGLTAPDIGETLFFTVNAVLNDGSVIPGWTRETGFNNIAFTGWRVDGRSFSYNVRYAVVCELVLDDFVGTCNVILDDWWGEEPYPVEVTKVGDAQLSIAGLFTGEATNPLVITIDPEDYSISFARQILKTDSDVWWGNPAYTNFSMSGSGIVDACNTVLDLEASCFVDAGSFGGGFKLVIAK